MERLNTMKNSDVYGDKDPATIKKVFKETLTRHLITMQDVLSEDEITEETFELLKKTFEDTLLYISTVEKYLK